MTGFDFVILAILVASGLLGLVRGLIKEVLSLMAFVLAFVAAIWWGPTVYSWLDVYIETAMLRMGIAYAAVFILVLLGIGLVNVTLAALVRTTGLTPANHGLGAVFGLARGLLFVLILVALGGYTPLPQESWWQNAMFSHSATEAVRHIKLWLPPSLSTWVPY